MYRRPPLRGGSPLGGKEVLLIDEKQATRDTRANVLRSLGVEVDTADTLPAARVLWTHQYDLILLNVRQQFSGEAFQFREQIRDASPGQRFAFLVGPPAYLFATGTWTSLTTLCERNGARL
jgi:CheY-like chemotaxis protein